MGPLFSLILIAMASAALFVAVFLVLKISLRTTDALLRAGGFVLGTGIGAVLFAGVLVLAMGTDVTLTTTTQVYAYLSAVALGALAGGIALSGFVAWKFRYSGIRNRSLPALCDSLRLFRFGDLICSAGRSGSAKS